MVLGVPAVTHEASHIDLGFDRIGWMRVVRHRDGLRFEVLGTARRRPRTRPVSAEVAGELVAAGVKVVFLTCRDCES
jgi:hypothetical protein